MLPSILLAGFLIQPLSEDELKLQLAYTTLHFIDYRQTKNLITTQGLEEKNLILGPTPSSRKVNTYFATTLLLHWTTVYLLPQEYRTPFQAGTIFLELAVIGNNKQLGLTLNF